MSMLHDNNFNSERVECHGCGKMAQRGNMYLSKCNSCQETKQKEIIMNWLNIDIKEEMKELNIKALDIDAIEEIAEYNKHYGLVLNEDHLSQMFDDSHDFSIDECNDAPLINETFSNWSDMLCKDNLLHELQYQEYCYYGKFNTEV